MPNLCEQAVTEYFAAIRAGDVERWVNTFAHDAISHDPVGAPPMQGHAALRQFLTHLGQSFQSVALTEEAVFVNGNSAAVKWTGKAISHSGKSVDFEGVDVLDCNDDGKITLVRAFWNPAPVMAIAQS
jgi:steroid delta-isomerase